MKIYAIQFSEKQNYKPLNSLWVCIYPNYHLQIFVCLHSVTSMHTDKPIAQQASVLLRFFSFAELAQVTTKHSNTQLHRKLLRASNLSNLI